MSIRKESPITYTAEEVFGDTNIKKWTEEGHWPPPPGIRVLPPTRPDPEAVEKLTKILLETLPAHLRNACEERMRAKTN